MQANKAQEKTCDVFIICPVRNVTNEERVRIDKYVKDLEGKGLKVHWPSRDTDQNDPIGLRICGDNREAIWNAKEIHVFYNPDSRGSTFDVGMAFAFLLLKPDKKVILINPDNVDPSNTKSFNNVLLALHHMALESQKRG